MIVNNYASQYEFSFNRLMNVKNTFDRYKKQTILVEIFLLYEINNKLFIIKIDNNNIIL